MTDHSRHDYDMAREAETKFHAELERKGETDNWYAERWFGERCNELRVGLSVLNRPGAMWREGACYAESLRDLCLFAEAASLGRISWKKAKEEFLVSEAEADPPSLARKEMV